MNDYQKQLDKYYNFPERRKKAEQYLGKYWLDKNELNEVWLENKKHDFQQKLPSTTRPGNK